LIGIALVVSLFFAAEAHCIYPDSRGGRLVNVSPLPSLAELPAFEALAVKRICTQFEENWAAGRRPVIEDHLTWVPAQARGVLLAELLRLELAYRRQAQEQPRPQEYCARFPEDVGLVEVVFAAAHSGTPAAAKTVPAEELGAEPSQAERPEMAGPTLGSAPSLPGSQEPDLAATAWKSTGLPRRLPEAEGVPQTRLPVGAVDSGGAGLDVVPGYEVLEELGRGGMGVVYRARQVSLKRIVALKTILAERHASADQRSRFQVEAEAVARLTHPNIVQVYEIGEYDGRPYFSMEYVEGTSLSQHLAGSLLVPRQAAALLAGVAEAIHFAHQHHIVHRDLKPANVLLAEDGTPKITDFGLAKQLQSDPGLTQSGAIVGTPSYMAPEQAAGRGKEIGPAADVYSLGAILYECLTGRPPFRGATVVDTLQQVREMEPVPPARLQAQVPRDLEVICLKCLRKEPARRYGSAGELADDLRRFLAGEPIQARPVGLAERLWRRCRRNPVVAGLLAAVALSLLCGLGGILYFAYLSAASARQAQEKAAQLRRGLIRQNLATGSHFLEAGQRAEGVWWYARGWELDAGNPDTEDNHHLCLGLTLQAGPQLVGICFHQRPVFDAVFDPAGKLVLTRTDEPQVYLWDPFTSRLVTPPLAHDGEVRSAMFSPSGEQVATGSADGQVRLWNTASGALLRALPQEGAVNSVAFRPDGQLLAAATEAGMVRFWNPRTGQPGAPTLELGAAVYHVAFSPDGRQAITADAGHVARVWDVASGKPVTGPLPHQDHRSENEFAICYRCWPIFSPDGSAVVTVHPNGNAASAITVWELASGKPRFAPLKRTYFVRQVRFSSDGSRLLVLSGDKVSLNDSAKGNLLLALAHPREVPHGCFRPDGKVLATCSTGGLIHQWDTSTEEEIDEPLRCADGVHSLSFSPDGQLLLAASQDGTARVWRLGGSDGLRSYAYDCGRADRIPPRKGKEAAQFSPDGRREVRYGGPAGVRLRNRDGSGSEVALAHPLPVRLARFSLDGGRLVTQDAQATLRFWDAATGQEAGPAVSLGARLYDLEFSADGSRLLTVEEGPGEGTAGRVVTVWDVARGRPLIGPLRRWDTGPQRFGERSLQGQICKAALSPDGTRLVLGADDTGTLGVWDVDGGRELARTHGYRGVLYPIRFSEDGQRFLTYGSDTVARLWHTATCASAGPALRHPRFCRRADLAPDGWRVVTVDAGKVIRLWDGRSGDLLGRIEMPLESNSIWFSRDGRRLVVNAGKQVLDLPRYEGDPASLPPLLQLLTGLERDADDRIGPVDPQTFLGDPEPFLRAWQEWRTGEKRERN
jgi:WD40 repeat protein/predicted Ser/Thr protein kinase